MATCVLQVPAGRQRGGDVHQEGSQHQSGLLRSVLKFECDTCHVTCNVSCAGNAVDYEWRSTGVCTNVLLSSATDTLSLYLESGGGSDCVQVRE